MEINLPILTLRDYQQEIWDRWFSENTQKAIFIWHRRSGKDLFCLQILIAEAIREIGNYWYVFPEAQQVRNSIWEGITADGMRYMDYIPKELIHKIDNQSMKIYLKNPKETK